MNSCKNPSRSRGAHQAAMAGAVYVQAAGSLIRSIAISIPGAIAPGSGG